VDVPQKLLVCLGFGIDAHGGVCHAHFLENVAALSRDDNYLGAWSLAHDSEEFRLYRDACEFTFARLPEQPSIVNTSIIAAVGGSFGDIHPYGNPHYMLDPVLAKTAAQNIYKALVTIAPEREADFKRNRDAYLAKLDAKIADWQEALKPFKGAKFVSYHEHWPYFAERFGLRYFGTIELKPGIDPTPRHIEEMIATMKAEHVPIVVREPQFPEKVPSLIAKQTGATLVKLPIMPGGVPHTDTYIEMMDYIVHTFGAALSK